MVKPVPVAALDETCLAIARVIAGANRVDMATVLETRATAKGGGDVSLTSDTLVASSVHLPLAGGGRASC